MYNAGRFPEMPIDVSANVQVPNMVEVLPLTNFDEK